MKEHEIVIGEKTFILKHEDLVDDIDIATIISIDYSNLEGDYYVTQLESLALGNYMADMEHEFDKAEVRVRAYEEEWKLEQKDLASRGKIAKVTDTGLAKAYTADKEWQKLMNDSFKKKMYLAKIKNLYWKIEKKIDRLNTTLREIVPEDCSDVAIDRALKRSHIMRMNKEPKQTKGIG